MPRSRRLEHLEDILLSLSPHRLRGCLPALDLHQRRGPRRARRATRHGSASGRASSAGWTGAGWRAERIARWYRQLHIFLYPFYYIEYGIAQLGALQVWRNSLQRSGAAVAAYRRALALGATRPLPELYAAAGAASRSMRRDDRRLTALVEHASRRFARRPP